MTSLQDFLNGREKFSIDGILQYLSIGTGTEGHTDIFFLSMHGQNQYFHLRMCVLDLRGSLYPSKVRHRYVDDSQLWSLGYRVQETEELEAIAHFAGDLKVAFFLEKPFQIKTEEGIVIGQDYVAQSAVQPILFLA